ncbi:MAG TPA: LysM peptidoglycan-binding domain-containing protein [Bryobacteraceae bacterium]|nr:LysM peptidoglycan-binding domain-containing protein [Bryobacteraceae bacterium]
MAEKRLDELKTKYGSVFRAIEQQQVRLQNVNMQGDKLFLRGEAPSQDAKNKVWDQIKMVDPAYSDLVADITVSQQQTMAAGAATSQSAAQETYTVQPGDTLSKIAERYYGDASAYMRIFQANQGTLRDPNRINPGQQLIIPK